MADELKDQRVVTMMSPSELEAIDEWSFKHRIRSRGEAIRRLCHIGMVSEEQPLMKLALHVIAHYLEGEVREEARAAFASGESLEVDVKRLCAAIFEERSKMGSFSDNSKEVTDAIETAKRLSRDYANARSKGTK